MTTNNGDINNQHQVKDKIWHGPPVVSVSEQINKWPSMIHFLFAKLEGEFGDRVIITDFKSSRQWTGQQLKDKIMDVACVLSDKYELQANTAVCLNYDNSDYALILGLAIVACGALVACVLSKDPYSELLYMAEKIEPKLLLCPRKNLVWAKQLSKDLGIEVQGIDLDTTLDELFSYNHQKTNLQCNARLPHTCTDLKTHVAFISMSSGTTGRPKAVPVTHYNVIADLSTMTRKFPPNTSFACTCSLDYVSGRLIMLGAMNSGYNAIILDGFDAKTFLEAVEKYKIAIIYLGSASFFELITYKHLSKYDLSSVRVVFPIGAKIIYFNELRTFFSNYPNIRTIRQGFGASEFSGGAMNAMTPDEYLNDSENCGHLLPGMSAKIVDTNTGTLLGPNQQGILHIKGESVFPGYYDIRKSHLATRTDNNSNEEQVASATPFVWDSNVFDEDGFYITGDLAYFNDHNQLYIKGRQNELMCCRANKKVLPHELEILLEKHPAVDKICVIGMPNKRQPTLHCPRAFVVVKSNYFNDPIDQLELGQVADPLSEELNEDLSKTILHHTGTHKLSSLSPDRRHLLAENLMNFINTQISWEKQLTGGIVLLDKMPISRTGKVNKNYLRSLSLNEVEIYGDQSS